MHIDTATRDAERRDLRAAADGHAHVRGRLLDSKKKEKKTVRNHSFFHGKNEEKMREEKTPATF